MANDFLTASTEAAKTLASARRRRTALTAQADQRLARATERHRSEVAAADAVEAEAWRSLMAVEGMTVATAAHIGGVGTSTARRWLAPNGIQAGR